MSPYVARTVLLLGATVGMSACSSAPSIKPAAAAAPLPASQSASASPTPSVTSPPSLSPTPTLSATPLPAPVTYSVTGTLTLVEAVDVGVPAENPKACLTLPGLQFLISDGSGTALGVGTPDVGVKTRDDSTSSAFIATCRYTYTIAGLPSASLYKETVTGDLQGIHFTGALTPSTSEYLTQAQVASGALPNITGGIQIGV
jgi:hypothetical protein